MKAKAIYSVFLSIMLIASFFTEARTSTGRKTIENKYEYMEGMRRLNTLRPGTPEHKELFQQTEAFRTNNPNLVRSWLIEEGKTADSVFKDNDGLLSLDTAKEGESNRFLRSIRINNIVGLSPKEKTDTINTLAEFTSLSKEQIREILDSRNTEAVDQLRQLAIHVNKNRESVKPETINTLVELAYTMRNREREASAQQNYTPSVNVMLSLVRNIASMASTWAATPRANALKLIAAFNAKYKEFKVNGRILTNRIAQDGLVASALNAALKVAEGIKNLHERNARKREIDVLCRK